MSVSLVLIIVGILALIESMFVLLFSKSALRMMKIWSKEKNLRSVGIWELVIALVLIGIGLLI